MLGVGPNVGDRVAYVFVHSDKSNKAYDKSEDPIKVLEKDIPLDIPYYIEHQLKKPLGRIFNYVIPNAEQKIFSGEHTRFRTTAKVANSVFSGYLTAKLTCLGCRTPIDKGAVCKNCEPKKRTLYVERLLELNNCERDYSDIWVGCLKCCELMHEPVSCHK